jgi:hypothetical protein
MEYLRKKNQTEILEIKSLFSQTKKHSGSPLQQTKTGRKQKLRTQREKETKEKNHKKS